PPRAIRFVPRAGHQPSQDGASGASIFAGTPGTSASFRWHGERMHYRCMGDGSPLILVHAPDVGASCVEWRRNIEAFAAHYTVYAVDLPGYGLSDIHKGTYTTDLYIEFLSDFMRVLTGPGT